MNCDICGEPIPAESGAHKVEAGPVEGEACDPCYAWLLAMASLGDPPNHVYIPD